MAYSISFFFYHIKRAQSQKVNLIPFIKRFSSRSGRWNSSVAYRSVLWNSVWKDFLRQYGSKSTVYRYHLYLCKHGVY